MNFKTIIPDILHRVENENGVNELLEHLVKKFEADMALPNPLLLGKEGYPYLLITEVKREYQSPVVLSVRVATLQAVNS